MFRLILLSTAIVIAAALYAAGVANAATFCSQGRSAGTERDCSFTTLKECRASVRAKGGGHCYRMRAKQ